jgi:glycosyltransferase involved in cell wall biosynthesis
VSVKPKVSVILPVYNASRFLEQCLESITSQTLTELEIICIDDCSTDNSLQILQAFQAKDNRIKIIRQSTNLGAAVARNTAMEIATGEYFSVLDADDYFTPDMFKISVERADELNLDVFVFGARAFNEATGEESDMSWTIKEHLLPDSLVFCANDVKEDFFQIFIWWAWDKLFRRSFIEKHGLKFQQIRTSNDLLFTSSAVLLAERIAYTKQPLVFQRQKLESSLSSTRHLSYDCCLKATVALKEFMQQQGIYERYERDFKNYVLNFLIWNINSIGQEAYRELYDGVKQFFATLNITREEIYYQPFYDAYLFILEHCAEEYLFYLRLKLGVDIEESHNKIASLEERHAEAQKEIDEFIDRVEYLTSEAHSANLTLEEIKAAKELLIGEHESIRTNYEAELFEKDQKLSQQSELLSSLVKELQARDAQIECLVSSNSWKITAPLRWIINKFK